MFLVASEEVQKFQLLLVLYLVMNSSFSASLVEIFFTAFGNLSPMVSSVRQLWTVAWQPNHLHEKEKDCPDAPKEDDPVFLLREVT